MEIGTMEIHLRDRETQKKVIEKGVRAILNPEILQDYYVKTVDCYQEELIIYLGDKYDARINQIKDITRTSGVYPLTTPTHPKQRPSITGRASV